VFISFLESAREKFHSKENNHEMHLRASKEFGVQTIASHLPIFIFCIHNIFYFTNCSAAESQTEQSQLQPRAEMVCHFQGSVEKIFLSFTCHFWCFVYVAAALIIWCAEFERFVSSPLSEMRTHAGISRE
jgi:hypothetical protein